MSQAENYIDWYSAQFELFQKNLNGKAGSPINQIRQKALASFSELGFPTLRDEEWRHTDISPIAAGHFKLAQFRPAFDALRKEIRSFTYGDPQMHQLVFINGKYVPELSAAGEMTAGVTVSSLAQAVENQPRLIEKYLAQYARYASHPFIALNTAFIEDGGVVHISRGTIRTTPIHLLFVAHADAGDFVSHPRTLIVAEESSQASVIESYIGLGKGSYLTNPVTEIVVADNAVVDHYKVQRESEEAYHVAVQQIYQGRNSSFTSLSLSFGGALVRNDINAVIDGEGSECILNGLYLASGQQHMDNHTLIDHAQPYCQSRELYKGILDDQSRGVFSGKIHVRKPAQKTDAIQSNKNLVLSENARIDTKPQLEIFADDVRCTHGGTVGQLDPNGIFYLRARGISEENARKIMVQAFAGDVTNRIKVTELREQAEALVNDRLARRTA